MTVAAPRILVTGASGITGRALAAALGRRGVRPQGLTSRPGGAPALREAGFEPVVGDLRDVGSLQRALAQADLVYHICPQMQADEAAIGHNVIDAARQVGVRRFVYHSVARSHLPDVVFHLEKTRVEIGLLHGGLPYTVVQPTNYMQNLRFAWPQVQAEGVFRFPYSAEQRMTWVDVHDVADAAAAILLEDGHEHATYELCGTPAPLSRSEMAAVIARELGRPVRAEAAPLDEYLSTGRWAARSTEERARIATMYRHYDRHGFAAGNTRVLAMLLGRAPNDYRAFVRAFIRTQEGNP
jgi:uncharacterized protein YbjT (DUF2867 family)